MNLKDFSFDHSWTLFLDRDGVINERIVDGYVTRWEDFVFLPGSLEAIRLLSRIFGRIIVVTNQQGVGKGLMTATDLKDIHKKMIGAIKAAGGKISEIYYSPHLEKENHITRKPNTGMALMAARQYPEIDFFKSVMVGDSIHDMLFGKQMKMLTVYISETLSIRIELVDFQFRSLLDFALEV